MNNIEDINLWIKTLEVYQSILKVNENEKEFIIDRIKYFKEKIDLYNKQYLTVVNPSKKEINEVYISLKKRILFIYLEDYLNKNYNHYNGVRFFIDEDGYETYTDEFSEYTNKRNKFKDEIINEIHELIYNTDLPLDLVYKKILLKRKYKQIYNYDRIGLEINEFIQLQLVDYFTQNNLELIKKLLK